jgi:hypothetical protein
MTDHQNSEMTDLSNTLPSSASDQNSEMSDIPNQLFLIIGNNRPFNLSPDSVKIINGEFHTRIDDGLIYDDCQMWRTKKPIKLSTYWTDGGRPFLYGVLREIFLESGSVIYSIPKDHPFYRLQLWRHLNVSYYIKK